MRVRKTYCSGKRQIHQDVYSWFIHESGIDHFGSICLRDGQMFIMIVWTAWWFSVTSHKFGRQTEMLLSWAGLRRIFTLKCTTVKVTSAWQTNRSLQPVSSSAWVRKQVKSLICLTALFWHMGKILKSMGKLLVGESFTVYIYSRRFYWVPHCVYFKSSCFRNSHNRTIRGKKEKAREQGCGENCKQGMNPGRDLRENWNQTTLLAVLLWQLRK